MDTRYAGALRGTRDLSRMRTEPVGKRRRRKAGSLRGQLVSHALFSIAIPLGLAGAIVFFFLSYHLDVIESSFARSRAALTNDIAGTDIRSQASNVARQLDEFLIERITESKAWASAPVVVDAARAAHGRHLAAGLVGTSIDAIEERFRARKSLALAPLADRYLRQQIASSPFFAEVFFTDRNGFNVALTNPTSDFVQSDEKWWKNAWSRQISVGEIEFDDSAGVWSIEISVRIEDPATGEPLGVMKSVLAIEPVQHIADRTAQTIPGGRVQVTTGNGALIAETSSLHARERIMSSEVDLSEQGAPSVLHAYDGDRIGFSTDEEWITGYARTGGRETYASVTEWFSGFDWIVILQRPLAGIEEPISALRAIESALERWRSMLGLGLGAVVLLSILVSVVLSAASARRLCASLQAVRELAERTARGESVAPAAIARPEEMVQVNEAVHRLGLVLMTVLRRSEPRRTHA